MFVSSAIKHDKCVGIASKNTMDVILSYLKVIDLDNYFKEGRIVTTDEVVKHADKEDEFPHVKDHMIKLLSVFCNKPDAKIIIYEDDLSAVVRTTLADGLWTPKGFTAEVWLGHISNLYDKCPSFEEMTGKEPLVPCSKKSFFHNTSTTK